jgi:hypothetical protein
MAKTTNKSNGKDSWWKVHGSNIATTVIGGLVVVALVWLFSISPRFTAIESDLKTLASKTDIVAIQGDLKGLTAKVDALAAKADKSDERIIALDSRLSKVEGMLLRQVSINVQFGNFSAKNKVSADPLTFEWKLATVANPSRLFSIVAEPISPIPGISISAHLVNDGNACRMVMAGDTAKVLPSLEAGIPAKVTISTREQ